VLQLIISTSGLMSQSFIGAKQFIISPSHLMKMAQIQHSIAIKRMHGKVDQFGNTTIRFFIM
jgi:hypothetical protein